MHNEMKKIMLVAKENFDTPVIISTLNLLGYRVSTFAGNDRNAVKKYSAEKPDLALIDMNFERGSNNVNTANVILKELKIPVVFLRISPDYIFPNGNLSNLPVFFVPGPLNQLELHAAIELALLNESIFSSN